MNEPTFEELFHVYEEPDLRCSNCARCMDKNCPCGNKQRHTDSCWDEIREEGIDPVKQDL